MADPVYMDRTKALARDTLNALSLLRQGVAELKKVDGPRAQLIGIGDGAVSMQHSFGTDTAASAQALSDRIAAYLAQIETDYVFLDLINATIDGSAPP